jgi:GAF domain-containing protein
MTVQPLPETRAALAALAEVSGSGDGRFLEQFTAAAEEARRIAPDCVGLTVTFVEDDVSFTWATTDLEAATLDAVQYLSGGPCVSAVGEGRVLTDSVDDGPLDERRWRTFAAACACTGVASTLSIPLLRDGRVFAGVNLYGGTPATFETHHDELAAVFGGWPEGAVTNADLALTSLARARSAPIVLEEAVRSNVAVGIIMAANHVPEDQARRTLSDAAARAGVSEGRVAAVLLATHGG